MAVSKYRIRRRGDTFSIFYREDKRSNPNPVVDGMKTIDEAREYVRAITKFNSAAYRTMNH
jgi:hypothetical protein